VLDCGAIAFHCFAPVGDLSVSLPSFARTDSLVSDIAVRKGCYRRLRRWLFFSLRLFLPSFLAGGAPAALGLAQAAPALHYTSDAGCARIVVSAFSGSAVEFPLFSLLRGCTTIRSDVVVPMHHLSSSFDCPVFAFVPPLPRIVLPLLTAFTSVQVRQCSIQPSPSPH